MNRLKFKQKGQKVKRPKAKPLTPLRNALYGHFRALFLQGEREKMRIRAHRGRRENLAGFQSGLIAQIKARGDR